MRGRKVAQRGRPGQDTAKGLGVPTCSLPTTSQQGFTDHLNMDSQDFLPNWPRGTGSRKETAIPIRGAEHFVFPPRCCDVLLTRCPHLAASRSAHHKVRSSPLLLKAFPLRVGPAPPKALHPPPLSRSNPSPLLHSSHIPASGSLPRPSHRLSPLPGVLFPILHTSVSPYLSRRPLCRPTENGTQLYT